MTDRDAAAGSPAERRVAARRAALLSAGTVGLVTLILLLVGWAALIGPSAVFEGPGLGRHEFTETTETASPSAEAEDQQQGPPRVRERGPVTSTILTILGVLLPATVLVLMLGAVLAALRYFWRLRRARMLVPGDEVAFDPVRPEDRAAAEMVADAPEQLRLLAEGTPRNAIVRCWERFESGAADAGLPRRPWETSSEYTRRALRTLRADPAAVEALAALFREARFSEHALDEETRADALAALESIYAGLRGAAVPGDDR